ncbi:hypothetical protein Z043_111351 [Scleropages formosus]|uniref:Cadherin EGF LAG seven-pass G-type receptor 1-like n=1 Tax=Scleropages formosus TaxID=113540 RepID=A0A0P7V9L6_SCLFO|nr:hypothetical protein Z043_111351 [Scleropages formosus]
MQMSIFLYILAARASCSVRHHSLEKKGCPVNGNLLESTLEEPCRRVLEHRLTKTSIFRYQRLLLGLRTASGSLLLVTMTCLLALLSVNSDFLIFHFLFAAFNCVQGPFIFFFRIVFNKEARKAMQCPCSRKRADMISSKSLASSYNYNSPYLDTHLYRPPFGDSGVSLNGTLPSGKSQLSYVPFVLREDRGLSISQAHIPLSDHSSLLCEAKGRVDGHDSDSDSDVSLEDDRSGSFASSHSSDSEEEEGPYPPEACWENLAVHGGLWPLPHGHQKEQHRPEDLVPMASERDALGITDRLKVEAPAHSNPMYSRGTRHLLEEEAEERGEGPGRTNVQLFLPSAYPQRGILKRKPLSPIVERNSTILSHDMLSPSAPGPLSSRGSSSSEGFVDRAINGPQDQVNDTGPATMTPVAISIKAGTVDGDSSGSE